MRADAKEIDQKLKASGYKFLGWQNGWANHPRTLDEKGFPVFGGYINQPEYDACIAKGHNNWKNPEHWDSIQHDNRGSENTVSCDVCKIYWKYDCSD
jgi:hypothetical protein